MSVPVRVGVICDFREEGWPSMDLVADLLVDGLATHSSSFAPTALRPAMPRIAERIVAGNRGLNADRFLGRHLAYPRWLRRHARGYDLYHVVDHSYGHLVDALPAVRTVVTCHDLDAFRSILRPADEPRPAWFRAMMGRVLRGLRHAAHVVCDSDAVRDELLAAGLHLPEHVTTVPLAAHPDFSLQPNADADVRIHRLIGDGNGMDILHVGSTVPRKRIDVLLEAIAPVLAAFGSARLLRVSGGSWRIGWGSHRGSSSCRISRGQSWRRSTGAPRWS